MPEVKFKHIELGHDSLVTNIQISKCPKIWEVKLEERVVGRTGA